MVEIIRNKWCDDLEELLQCPICFVRPKAWIHQCIQGHHICEDCKGRLQLCPTCSNRWSSSRNRLAENLCAKLDDIKLSLIDPEAEINKLMIPNRVSVASQTDGSIAAAAAGPPPKKSIDDHAGTYPCRVGSCGINLSFVPLMKHIKADHSTQFLELPLGDGSVFQCTWPIDYAEQMTFDRAFQVPDMGTFILKLSTDVFGNFTGFVMMLHNGLISKQFTYQMEISCCQEHACSAYTGEVCSCRTPAGVLKEKSLQASRTEMVRMTNHEKQLKCTLLLGKKPQTEEAEQPKNQERKNNPRSRNNARGMGRGRGMGGGQGMGRGQANNPQNPHHMHNNGPGQHRPQTAPNGQVPPLMRLPPRFPNRPPSRTSSISSLPSLYPDLREF